MALLFAALAAAQTFEPMPSFNVMAQPPPTCNSEAGYTCSPVVQVVNWTLPDNVDYSVCNGDLACHLEYCFVANPPVSLNAQQLIPAGVCHWTNDLPTTITLPLLTQGNTVYTVYSEYRLVYGGTPNPSRAASSSPIILNTAQPTVILNSPSGLPNTNYQQAQYLNAAAAQAVTYTAASVGTPAETVTVTVNGCRPPGGGSPTCIALNPDAPPLLWPWSGSSPADNYSYLRIAATDQAGVSAATPAPTSLPVIQLFDPTSAAGPQSVTCGPLGQSGTVPCAVLADGTENSLPSDDIAGDPPSCVTQMPTPQPTDNGILYCGYADPSMRRDPQVTGSNPYGTNLWMGYSFPLINTTYAPFDGHKVYIPAVETHLASSPTSDGSPGGRHWSAWCDGCEMVTPIYPSVGYTPPGLTNPTQFSSHEVFNFWPVPDYPAGSETWYAVHLMYFVHESHPSTTDGIQNHGCLVISFAQDSPTNLAWPATGTQPIDCSGEGLPSGSSIQNYDYPVHRPGHGGKPTNKRLLL